MASSPALELPGAAVVKDPYVVLADVDALRVWSPAAGSRPAGETKRPVMGAHDLAVGEGRGRAATRFYTDGSGRPAQLVLE